MVRFYTNIDIKSLSLCPSFLSARDRSGRRFGQNMVLSLRIVPLRTTQTINYFSKMFLKTALTISVDYGKLSNIFFSHVNLKILLYYLKSVSEKKKSSIYKCRQYVCRINNIFILQIFATTHAKRLASNQSHQETKKENSFPDFSELHLKICLHLDPSAAKSIMEFV